MFVFLYVSILCGCGFGPGGRPTITDASGLVFEGTTLSANSWIGMDRNGLLALIRGHEAQDAGYVHVFQFSLSLLLFHTHFMKSKH